MGKIQSHIWKDGTTVSWRVKWVQDGDSYNTVTFADEPTAVRFNALITGLGNRWPAASILRDAGFGFLPEAQADQVADPRLTLVDAILSYLDTGKTIKRANAETIAEYRDLVEQYITPFFGSMALLDVHRYQLSAWQDWMVDIKGLSPKTIGNARGSLLNPVLKKLMTRGDHGEDPLRDYNPLDELPLPERHTPFVRTMLKSVEEANIFLSAAMEIDPHAHDLLLTKLGQGMRWGEVSALPPWAVHIDPDTYKGTIEIMQVAARHRGKLAPGTPRWFIRNYPKTPAGFRTVPVHPRVGKVLASRLPNATDLMFTNTVGKLWYSSTFHTNRWTPILELARKNGLPRDITPHGLRKSLISLLYESNIDPVTTATLSGHNSPATGMKFYTGDTARQHDQVRDAIGAGLLGIG